MLMQYVTYDNIYIKPTFSGEIPTAFETNYRINYYYY